MTKNLLNIFFSICFSLIISIGIIEIVVRNIIDDGMNYDLEMMKYAKNLKIISNDKKIGIEHKKNKKIKLMGAEIVLNSNGLRNIEEIDLNKKKIMMLGDSMTFGWGAQTTFSDVLGGKLKKNYQVLNSGIGNTNTIMQINNFFKNYSRFDYDYIILNFFINDFEHVEIKKINFIQQHLYSYTYIKSKLINLLIKTGFSPDWKKFYLETFIDKEFINASFKEIQKLKIFCEKNDINFFIHIIPELYDLKNYAFVKQTEKLKSFAIKNNINFLDSIKSLKRYNEEDLWVSNSDTHANNKAHEIIGNFLFEEIFTKKKVSN